jgi:hypothetical protein
VIDPLGVLIAELRTANIASGRVRGGEAAPGDAKDPGHFQRFVVLVRLGYTRLHRTPMQIIRIGVRAYSSTFQDAAALYGEISDAIDNAGPRLSGSGIPIYQSLDDVGGAAEKDPDTGQPYETGVIELYAGTQVLAGS